jgi:hypothetical protein
LLRDDFQSTTLGPAWDPVASQTGADALTGSALALSLPAGSSGRAVLSSRDRYQLTGNTLAVEVSAAPSQTAGAVGQVLVVSPTGEQSGMLFHGNSIDILFGGQDGITLTPGVTPRYWRIREGGGSLHWETSLDGVNWNPAVSISFSGTMRDLSVEIGLQSQVPALPPPGASFVVNRVGIP